MRKIYFIFILISYFKINAQVAFHKSYGGSTGDYAREAIETADRGYIVIGQTNSFGAGGWDIYLVKTNSDGNVAWKKTYGGTSLDFGNSVRQTADGGYILTGYTQSFGVAGSDVFLIKIDSNGNILWQKTYGGIHGDDGQSVEKTFDGGYIIIGSSDSFGASEDVYLMKTDSNGNLQWTKTFGGGPGNSIGHDGKQTSDGGFIIVGETYSLGIGGEEDIYLIKVDASGNKVWSKTFGGIKADYGYSIQQTSDGGYILAGYTYSYSLTGGCLDFLIKTDNNGIVLWAKTYGSNSGGEIGYSVQLTSDKGYVIAGETNGFGADGTDMYLVKTDSVGNTLWSKTFFSNTSYESARSIRQISNGGYILAGSKSLSSGDFYLIKTESNGNSGCEQTNPSTIDSNVVFVIASPSETVSSGGVTGIPSFITSSAGASVFTTLCDYTGKVWPGDSDNNYVVDNNDILSIGLYYTQTGTSRDSISNLWQADSSKHWGISQLNGFDIKHVDCNGDGIIDMNDTSAVNLNFSFTHTIASNNSNERQTTPNLYFVTSNNTYNSGDFVDVEVWLGSSTTPVNNLYGIAFDINYTASLVQTMSENISYPNSWLGTPGTNAIKISKVDVLSATVYGAETRINHINANGYGKIADFKFQLKNSIPSNTKMKFSFSNYTANDSIGNAVQFNIQSDSIVINPSAIGIKETTNSISITVFPNPFTSQTTISFNKEIKNARIKIVDVVGKEVRSINFSGSQLIIGKEELKAGIYFMQVVSENEMITNKKIVIQ